MKKTIGILLCILFLFLTGCGKNVNESQKVYNLGEEIKTDILKVKLLNARYVNSVKNNTIEVNAHEGNTLVEFTFYVENLGESEIKFAGSSQARFNSIEFNNKEYENNAIFLAKSFDNSTFEDYSLDYITLLGKNSSYFRAYMDIPVKINDLSSKVKINFYLPEGKANYQKFTYTS